MFNLYAIILALCGQPKMNFCRLDSINCYQDKRNEMSCTFGAVITRGGKEIHKTIKLKKKTK